MKKKLITVITIIAFLTGPGVKPAHAFIPLVFTGVFSAASLASWIEASFWVHAAAAGAYAWYHSRGDNKKKVDPNGNIYRGTDITWVDLKDGNPVGKNGKLIASVEFDKAKAALEANTNPAKYPNLKEALKKTPPTIDANRQVWDIVNVPGIGIRKILSVYKHAPYCGSIPPPAYYYASARIYASGGGLSCPQGTVSAQCTDYTYEPASKPPGSNKDFAKNLANDLSEMAELLASQDIYSDRYGNEIDDFLKDNPQIIDMKDGDIDNKPEDSTPYNPPTMPSKDSVDSAGGGGANPGGGSGGGGSGGSGAPGYPPNPFIQDSDGDGVPDDSDGDGTPDVPPVEEDEDTAFQPPGDNKYDDSIDQPEKKNIASLLSSFLASSPLVALVSGITLTGSSPESSFEVNAFGKTLRFDFAEWSGIMAGCGTALLAVSHIAAIFLIFRRDE